MFSRLRPLGLFHYPLSNTKVKVCCVVVIGRGEAMQVQVVSPSDSSLLGILFHSQKIRVTILTLKLLSWWTHQRVFCFQWHFQSKLLQIKNAQVIHILMSTLVTCKLALLI
uniref:Uncharacterized protein n=1 Tax=Salix viminalis TaxID=40686 RepID=A0A6N2NBU0_SALVM